MVMQHSALAHLFCVSFGDYLHIPSCKYYFHPSMPLLLPFGWAHLDFQYHLDAPLRLRPTLGGKKLQYLLVVFHPSSPKSTSHLTLCRLPAGTCCLFLIAPLGSKFLFQTPVQLGHAVKYLLLYVCWQGG